MGNEPCADNYGPVNVMELRERIFQETEREKAQDYLWNELVLLQSQTFRTMKGLEYDGWWHQSAYDYKMG